MIPQIPYDRELLIEALKSGAETIIDNSERIVPLDVSKLRGFTASILIETDAVASINITYDMFPNRIVYPYRNYAKDLNEEAEKC